MRVGPMRFCAGMATGILLGISIVLVYFMIYLEDSTCYLKSAEAFSGGGYDHIPRVIMQTHYDLGSVPSKVAQQFEKLAAGFERKLYEDAAAADFIRKHYTEDMARVFESFTTGAFKADFFRYCYLYIEGGIYLDIKTELVLPLQLIYDKLRANGTSMATCLTDFTPIAPHSWTWPCTYQGIIFARPKHPIFLECLAYMKSYAWRGKWDYLAFCRNFTTRLHDRGMAFPGVYPDAGWTLWAEKVSFSTGPCGGVRPKTCVCSVIREADTGETLFVTRFADFPWGKRK
jgi:Glycosyltransferase sugar-binding region containing DXD motif